jgi:hypothetical protein
VRYLSSHIRHTPVPIDEEISSLSAILLNDDYYNFLRSGASIVDGIPIIGAAHLIPFKAKAWLDLTERKSKGGQVDSKNIRKHKNDIIALSDLLSQEIKIILPDSIAGDLEKYLADVDTSEKYVRVVATYNLLDTAH